VLENPRPVMVLLWSEAFVPKCSAALATVLDEIVIDFDGNLDAVRASSMVPCTCCCEPAFARQAPARH